MRNTQLKAAMAKDREMKIFSITEVTQIGSDDGAGGTKSIMLSVKDLEKLRSLQKPAKPIPSLIEPNEPKV